MRKLSLVALLLAVGCSSGPSETFIAAVRAGRTDEVQKMLQDDPDVRKNWDTAPGMRPALFSAVATAKHSLVKLLLDDGADANASEGGSTALHFVGFMDTPEAIVVMMLLISRGAKVDSADPTGATPLMRAVVEGSPLAVELLVRMGANPLVKNSQGKTVGDLLTDSDAHKECRKALAVKGSGVVKPNYDLWLRYVNERPTWFRAVDEVNERLDYMSQGEVKSGARKVLAKFGDDERVTWEETRKIPENYEILKTYKTDAGTQRVFYEVLAERERLIRLLKDSPPPLVVVR